MNESKGKFICPNAIITIEFSPIIMNIVKEVIKNGFIKMKIIMEK